MSATQPTSCSSASRTSVSQPLSRSSGLSGDRAVSKPGGQSAADMWPVGDYVCPFHHLSTQW